MGKCLAQHREERIEQKEEMYFQKSRMLSTQYHLWYCLNHKVGFLKQYFKPWAARLLDWFRQSHKIKTHPNGYLDCPLKSMGVSTCYYNQTSAGHKWN